MWERSTGYLVWFTALHCRGSSYVSLVNVMTLFGVRILPVCVAFASGWETIEAFGWHVQMPGREISCPGTVGGCQGLSFLSGSSALCSFFRDSSSLTDRLFSEIIMPTPPGSKWDYSVNKDNYSRFLKVWWQNFDSGRRKCLFSFAWDCHSFHFLSPVAELVAESYRRWPHISFSF